MATNSQTFPAATPGSKIERELLLNIALIYIAWPWRVEPSLSLKKGWKETVGVGQEGSRKKRREKKKEEGKAGKRKVAFYMEVPPEHTSSGRKRERRDWKKIRKRGRRRWKEYLRAKSRSLENRKGRGTCFLGERGGGEKRDCKKRDTY